MIRLTSVIFLFLIVSAFSQSWQQTASTPEGSGVTDMVLRQSNQHLFVTTGSFNWPNGDNGGVRRSTDDGTSWQNLLDVYIARTIIDGGDGNLYASIWPYPQDEGLYRSTNNGDSWGSPLVTVPSGNNIFSIALNSTTTTQTIFAGTRNGPMRSTDNGATWSLAINGIPPNSWVRDIEVDSVGYVVAATTNGVFTSTNNGDLWEQATGIVAGDTIVKISFVYSLGNLELADQTRILAGSSNGNLEEALYESKYLLYTLMAVFGNHEVSGIGVSLLYGLNEQRYGVTTFPKNGQGGGFSTSSDNGVTWLENNKGLPSNPNISALASFSEETGATGQLKYYIGMFNNTNGGANIYKLTYSISDVERISTSIPDKYGLEQNYPNPFNPSTKINYQIPKAGNIALKIYDVLGNEVATLFDEYREAGEYEINFDSGKLSGGVYFYQLNAGGFSQTRKMILIK